MKSSGTIAWFFAAICAATLATACGGDDDENGNGGGSVTTSVDGAARLGDLSDADFQTLCGDVNEYLSSPAIEESSKNMGCRLAGLVVGSFAFLGGDEAQARAACSQAADDCLAAENQATPETDCTKPSTLCTATVDEVTACMESLPAALDAIANALPECNELTADNSGVPGGGNDETTPECQVLQEKCPEFEVPDTTGATTTEL